MSSPDQNFDALRASLDEVLAQAPSWDGVEAIFQLLLALSAADIERVDREVSPTLAEAATRYPSAWRVGYPEMVVDLVAGRLPTSVLFFVSALELGPMLMDFESQQRLAAWMSSCPADGPALDGVRLRVPDGNPRELSYHSVRQPLLASPLLRNLRVFDASAEFAFYSIYDHPDGVSVSGDDCAFGFTLDEVLTCSPCLEVVNLFGESAPLCLPNGWHRGKHRLSRVLRAVNVGGGEPVPASFARDLFRDSAVEALYCKAGSVADQWRDGEGEEPYRPPRRWSKAYIAQVREEVVALEYGHIGSTDRHEPFAPTDWASYFGPTASAPVWRELPSEGEAPAEPDQAPIAPDEFSMAASFETLQRFMAACPAGTARSEGFSDWGSKVSWLLKQAYQHDPTTYRSTWLPFLEASPIWANRPLKVIRDAELLTSGELNRWAEFMPFATFDFTDLRDHSPLLGFDKKRLAGSLALPYDATHHAAYLESLATEDWSGLRYLAMGHTGWGDSELDRILSNPHIKGLTKFGTKGSRGLIKMAELEEVETLWISEKFDAEAADALVRSPAFATGLNDLDLVVDADALDALNAQTTTWERLESLSLSSHTSLDTHDLALLRTHAFPRLTTLSLRGGYESSLLAVEVDLPALESLKLTTTFEGFPAAPMLAGAPKLEELELSYFKSAKATDLAKCPHLKGIKRLKLRGCKIGFKGMAQLLASPHLETLEELDLSGVNESEKGTTEPFAKLKRVPPKLHRLDLSENTLTPEIIGKGLAKCDLLEHVSHLDLSRNPIAAKGLRLLAGSGLMRNLQHLDLDQTELTTAGLKVLAKDVDLSNLEWLSLEACEITDAGLKALLAVPMPKLRYLNLTYNSLKDAGFRALAASPILGQLETLKLANNLHSDKGIKALADALDSDTLQGLDIWNDKITWMGGPMRTIYENTALSIPARLQFGAWWKW